MGRWTSSEPAYIAWHRKQMSRWADGQMSINNDIAGLARCPRAELFAAKLEAQGLGPADWQAALTEYFRGRAREWLEQQSAPTTTSSKP